MAKKLVSVWLSLTVLLFSSISIYAEENVQGIFFTKNIVVNGETIDNNHLQFPFFLYKNSTYMPLTPEMCEIFGMEAELDVESRTLKLLKTEPTLTNISDAWRKNERKNVIAEPISNLPILAYEMEPQSLEGILRDAELLKDADPPEMDASGGAEGTEPDEILDEIITVPMLSVREIDLAGLPVLLKGSILYLPVKALAGENGIGWDVHFDPYTGVYVSTKEGISAVSYWNKEQSSYNRGLVNYVMKYNGNYTESRAQELIFLFRNAAKAYNIDEKILMAVARRESNFTPTSKSSSGALGMMQVMPATGARYGLGPAQLLDAETSINFGAMYLSERIAAYGGDLVKGFSAYSQGSVKVNRGTHSTRYAGKVLETIRGIDTYLVSNGFESDD